MNRKIIFLDVDGTLIDFIDGEERIPESAKTAIRRTRAKGNLVYLCTGRSLPSLSEDITSIGFDGVIGGAGAFVASGGDILFHHTLTLGQVDRLTEFFRQNDIAYLLETNEGTFASEGYFTAMQKAFPHINISQTDFFAQMKPMGGCPMDSINKVLFTSLTLTFEEISNALGGEFDLVKSSYGGDISGVYGGEVSCRGVDKGSAILFLLKRLGLDKADSYAFGDSMNDRQMFESVGTAIAMGNSKHGVEAYAHYITTPIDRDGIYNGMEHFGLI